MVQCLMVDCLIAISSVNCQLLLDCIEKTRNCRKGNLPGLFFDSLLQCWDRGCLPSNFINSLFKHGDGALRHLPTCCFKIVLLEVGYAVNRHHYIRFLRITIIPFICQYHCSGYYWLWMVLASAHYTNNTLTFLLQQGFFSKLHPQGCKPTMCCFAPAGRNLARAQTGFLWWRLGGNFNPGTKAENQEGPANSRSDDPHKHSQGATGSLRLKWLLGRLPLDIEPRPIRH